MRVITYGTFDLLHYGHIRFLERAKALGDYLIVGVTSDDYDMARGKLNNQQSSMERIEAVKSTGLADEIIIEEYEGQKIDDIKRLNVDIFTLGSDWSGKYDYLNEYCKVVYIDRTNGISSTDIRSYERNLRLGFVGDFETRVLSKYLKESKYVNGIEVAGICSKKDFFSRGEIDVEDILISQDYSSFINGCDAIYILSHPKDHYIQVREALEKGKHVLCEAPIGLRETDYFELEQLANKHNLILMNSTKTAYSTAYYRLLLLLKSGKIGEIVHIDATCTSIQNISVDDMEYAWNSICSWGPTAMLPVFQIMGTDYDDIRFVTRFLDKERRYDAFTKIGFLYSHGMADILIGRGLKSEGDLVVSGTKGYVYVPAPWWKTDYFEIRYENPSENRRYYYQLDGEGIRYELVDFLKSIQSRTPSIYISSDVTAKTSEVIRCFYDEYNLTAI